VARTNLPLPDDPAYYRMTDQLVINRTLEDTLGYAERHLEKIHKFWIGLAYGLGILTSLSVICVAMPSAVLGVIGYRSEDSFTFINLAASAVFALWVFSVSRALNLMRARQEIDQALAMNRAAIMQAGSLLRLEDRV
jgi:hypothetical protein